MGDHCEFKAKTAFSLLMGISEYNGYHPVQCVSSTSVGGGGCSVHRRDTMNTSGGYHEYIGGCSVHWRDTMMNVGNIMIQVGEYHEYIGVSI